MTDFRKLTDAAAAAPQIALDDLAAAAAAGFKTIVSNRPDGEEPGQPSAAEIKAAAEAEGLAFLHLPVAAMPIAPEMLDAFSAAEGPVLAFCKSGLRSAYLWAFAEARSGTLTTEEIIAAAAAAGFNVSQAAPALESGIANR